MLVLQERERKNAKWQCRLRQKRGETDNICVCVWVGEGSTGTIYYYCNDDLTRGGEQDSNPDIKKNIHTGPMGRDRLKKCLCVCVSHDKRMCGVCSKQGCKMTRMRECAGKEQQGMAVKGRSSDFRTYATVLHCIYIHLTTDGRQLLIDQDN